MSPLSHTLKVSGFVNCLLICVWNGEKQRGGWTWPVRGGGGRRRYCACSGLVEAWRGMIGSTVWVFHIHFFIGRGQQVPARWEDEWVPNVTSGSESKWSLYYSAIKIAFISRFFYLDFLHNGASSNKMPQVLSRLLSEIHVNIFTRRLQGISLRSQA